MNDHSNPWPLIVGLCGFIATVGFIIVLTWAGPLLASLGAC